MEWHITSTSLVMSRYCSRAMASSAKSWMVYDRELEALEWPCPRISMVMT
jgi:hypothetical protein